MQTLESIVSKAVSAAYDLVDFAFQGGEPTLAGLDFFEQFILLLNKHNKSGTPVCFSIQTNGLLIDEKWANFFHANDFLVGLSIDGTRILHDLNRVDADGKGTYRRSLNALNLLKKSGTEVNALCVVTNQTTSKAQSVYENLKKEGFTYLQFIPCLAPLDAEGEKAGDYLSPENYARFLKTLFDLWYLDWEKGAYVSIRAFDDFVHLLVGNPPSSCAALGVCGSYLTVESDGSVYPCDFYTTDQWHLGNINDLSLSKLFQNHKIRSFIEESKQVPKKCSSCKYLTLCRGGCKRNRTGPDGLNLYCPALIAFFDYASKRLSRIASLERSLSFSRAENETF
jgi:uncharacterized protein